MFKTSNVTILVSDMNKTIRFYTEMLGLKLVSNYGEYFSDPDGTPLYLIELKWG